MRIVANLASNVECLKLGRTLPLAAQTVCSAVPTTERDTGRRSLDIETGSQILKAVSNAYGAFCCRADHGHHTMKTAPAKSMANNFPPPFPAKAKYPGAWGFDPTWEALKHMPLCDAQQHASAHHAYADSNDPLR